MNALMDLFVARCDPAQNLRRTSRPAALSLLLLLALFAPGAARAQRFGLIARDGASLRLVRHDLEIAITHPVAETVVTQEFENREAVSLEAFFHYPVPPSATVVGLALWVNGERREARMLERQKAREIYDGIVREKRDPALLERVEGGFRIRIFPVLPRSRTRVELRFVEPVAAVARDRYQLVVRRPPGEPIHVFRVGVRLRAGFPIAETALRGIEGELVQEGQELRLPASASLRSFKRDLEIHYRRADAPAPLAIAVRHEGKQLLLAEPPIAAGPDRDARETRAGASRERPPAGSARRWAILIDGSRSMAPHLAATRSLAARLVAELPSRDQVAVASFDLLPRDPIAPQSLDANGQAEAFRRIVSIQARGGSAFLPGFTRALAAGVDAVVLFTDGGTRYHQEELEQLLRLSVDRPGVRVFVLLAPGGANEEVLTDLSASSGGLLERLEENAGVGALVKRIEARAAPEVRLESAFPMRVIPIPPASRGRGRT